MPEVEALVARLSLEAGRFEAELNRQERALRALPQTGERANARLGQSFQRSAREVQRASSGLRQLRLSLGGAEAATQRLAIAQARINAALRAGIIDQVRAIELSRAATASISAQATATTGLAGAYGKAATGAAALSRFIPGLAAFFTVTTLSRTISDTLGFAAAISVAADNANIGAEALQRWRFAGEQSGTTATQIDEAVRRLNRRLGLFVSQGGGPAARAFQSLGIAGRITAGELRDTEEVFETVIGLLADIPDAAQRAALASQLFGEDAGPRLGALLREGRDGIQALIDQAPILSDAQTRAAREIEDAWDQTTQNISVWIKSRILDVLAAISGGPIVDQLVDVDAIRSQLEIAREQLRQLQQAMADTAPPVRAAAEEVLRLETALELLRRQGQVGRQPLEVDITTAGGIEPPGAPTGPIRPPPMSRAEAQDFGLEGTLFTPGPGNLADDLQRLHEQSNAAAQAQRELAIVVQESGISYEDARGAAAEFSGILASGLTQGIFAGEALGQTLVGVTRRLSEAVVEALLFQSIMAGLGFAGGAGGGGFGGLFGALFAGGGAGGTTGAGGAGFSLPTFGGPRQHGGPVRPGQLYSVGERGPELFRPDTPGQIIPHHALMSALAGTPQAGATAPRIEVGGVEVFDYRGTQAPPIETQVDAAGLVRIAVRSEIGAVTRDGSLNRALGVRQRGIARG